MRFAAALLLALTLAASAFAADAVEEVRQAEIAFAKAFADRDEARFFSYVLDDATFMGAAGTQRGKKAVVEVWSRFFKAPAAPFSWGPERVVVNGAGNLGLSMGPIYDPNGRHVGNYVSTWQKQADGSWKVIFDGPGYPAAAFAESAPATTEGFVTTEDGAKLYYRKVGNSPVTLVVPLDFLLFDEFKQLADVATIVAYDPRNRGKSSVEKDPARLSIQQDVKDLEAVRAHFKLERFIPVGYSYLGVAVAMYAMEHPQRVARLIQLGPGPMRPDPALRAHGRDDMGADPAKLRQWQEQQAAGAAAKTPREFCELQWSGFLSYLLVGNPARVSRLKNPCALENEWPVNFERHMQTHGPTIFGVALTDEQLQKVTMPVLTIHGTKDRNAPYEGGRRWAAALPNARLVTVPGAGHAMWADDPVVVFGSIREFLRREWPLGAEKVTR